MGYYLIPGNGIKNLLRPFFRNGYQRLTKVPDNGVKNLSSNYYENMCLSFCKLDSLKIMIDLNHCKCTDLTSNKSGFSLSLDIIPTRIEDDL